VTREGVCVPNTTESWGSAQMDVRPEILPLPASLSRFWVGLGRLSSLINSRSKGEQDKGAIPETTLKSKGTLRGDEPYGDSPRAQLMDFSGGE
jgi:hypothetical protein